MKCLTRTLYDTYIALFPRILSTINSAGSIPESIRQAISRKWTNVTPANYHMGLEPIIPSFTVTGAHPCFNAAAIKREGRLQWQAQSDPSCLLADTNLSPVVNWPTIIRPIFVRGRGPPKPPDLTFLHMSDGWLEHWVYLNQRERQWHEAYFPPLSAWFTGYKVLIELEIYSPLFTAWLINDGYRQEKHGYIISMASDIFTRK